MHIPKTLLILFVVWWSSLGCFALEPENSAPRIPLTEITQSQNLLFAQQTSPQVFFSRILNRRLRKTMVGNWKILHDDGVFIYYGYPLLKNLFSDEQEIKMLYKVSAYQVHTAFPEFKRFLVHHSESHNRDILKEKLQPAFEETIGWLSQIHYTFDEERPQFFEVSMNTSFKQAQCRYGITLDLPEGKVIKIEQLPIHQKRSEKCPKPSL